jgi:predicted dehydrogenase
MKKQQNGRLQFIKNVTFAGIGLGMAGPISSVYGRGNLIEKGRVGIIGLDTSHCIAFAKLLNAPGVGTEFGEFKIIAAYPKGSNDIKSSVERIPEYTNEIKQYGVEIVDSIEDLLNKVDVVLLETNDGRLHLQQALAAIKAKKPLFIDKPITASLKDAIAIFDASKQYNVPVFSTSALRFVENLQDIASGKFGKVLGADTYSPATLEKTHPDLFWYGIHGVEILYTAMGTGCKTVVRVHTEGTDVVVGTWNDGRIGVVRGTRTGEHEYGGTIYTEKGIVTVGRFDGYNTMVKKIIEFFQTGIAPVRAAETLEMLAFMEAADASKLKDGIPVSVDAMFQIAKKSIR